MSRGMSASGGRSGVRDQDRARTLIPDPRPLTPATAGSQAPRPRPTTPKVIKFSHVSKRFTLHHERPRSFQEMVVNLFGLRNPSRRGLAMPRPVKEEFWALRDVNFSIYAGEAGGIIGEKRPG